MANSEVKEKGSRVSVIGRIGGGVLAIAFAWASWGFFDVWRHVPTAGDSWGMGALFMLVFAGLFGYAAVTGRSPMPQDRRRKLE